MTNPSKRKGAAFERLIADYFAEWGPCERIPAGATEDRGDLWLPAWCVQVKNRSQLSLGAWLDATEDQQENARKPYHWLVVKRRGSGDPAKQFAICTVEQARRIIEEIDN